MTDIKHATDLLSQCKNNLQDYKRQAEEISQNQAVIDWQNVNIDSFSTIIDDLGLPPDLRQSRDSYPGIVRSLLKEINSLKNSIENLEADISLRSLPAREAVPQAQRLTAQVLELVPSVDKLHRCKTELESSSIALKKNLTIKSLLPLARNSVDDKKKPIFETGYSIYLITTRETDLDTEGLVNMYTYFDQASHLQSKITELRAEGVSKMATPLINRQLRICNDGLQEVKDFVLFIEDFLKKDMDHINVFHSELAEVTQKPLTDILFALPHQTLKVSACIRDFTHKKFLIEELDRAAQLLLMVQQFYTIFHDQFLGYFREQTSTENSLINPATLAKARAASYFGGLAGIWRLIRIFCGTFKQHPVISQEILQHKLQKLLENCTHCVSHNEEDLEQISALIDSSFHHYTAPFPYNDLVNVAKKCIMTYGTILEKMMSRYKTSKDDPNMYSLGRLSGKIEVRTANLQKYRQKTTQTKALPLNK